MPDSVTVKITGLDQLQAKLEKELPEKARAKIREALTEGAQPIYHEMEQTAPVGAWAWLRGAFDIKFRFFEDGKAGHVHIGPSTKLLHPQSPGDKRPPLPASVVARFLEFGTRKMSSNPFITRAFEAQKDNALGLIVQKLKEILQ